MNPLFQQALGSIFRWAFALGAGILVERGIWTRENADTYAAALALAVVSLLWSLWNRYRSRIKFLTALELPTGSTEADVHAVIQAGRAPSALGR